jgi:DNA repair exonuclease SbcCD ATPase subunit
MAIVFRKIKWKNFLSTGNLFTEINLHGAGTTLIVGENGSGKSTMLDALTFALFGKPFRKVNKGQLINTITKKDMVVEIEFDIGANKYKIIRGTKPNVFEVYQNGVLLNQSAEMKDYQEILEKQILKINLKSFCQVVVLGSASFVPFMQLPGGQRREIIEDLLDLQIFTVMNGLLKDKIIINNDLVNTVTNDQKIINEKIKLIHEHMLEQQNNNEKIINEKLERVEETNKKIVDEKDVYQNYGKQITELRESIADEESITKKLNKLSSLRHKIEAKVALLSKDVDFFSKHKDCPTCKQVIDDGFRAEAIESKTALIDESQNGLEMLGKEYDSTSEELKKITQIQSDISDLSMKQFQSKNKIESLIKYRDEIIKEIEGISKQQEEQDEDKIVTLEAEYKDVVNRYNEAIEQKQVYSAAAMLLKDGGIKSKIVRQYIPIINKLINKYLSAMEFLVQFELDEEFNETIRSRHRDEFSYASFSEGEKMRINLAILFCWRAVAKLRNSVNTNILIMDEVFDSSLGINGTEEFMKILNNLTNDTNTFIISHKTDQLFDKFESVIRFEKHKNFSRITS